MALPRVSVDDVRGALSSSLSKLGFEVYPLKIGWYNAVLSPPLHLSYPDDTLAAVVLSTPTMFEQAFLPFLENRGWKEVITDPIDQCVRHYVNYIVSECFPGVKVDVSYDYEMLPSRKPKFLAQTAAHVAGAVYYYQHADVPDQPWGNKKMFGVCIHPQLGGWFAIRALLVFVGTEVGSELQQTAPPDSVPRREDRIQLLENFNFRWRDWSYRDIIPVAQTYSQRQREYFSTSPGQRQYLLRDWGYLTRGEEEDKQESLHRK
ncbi:methylmalonic aciduria and homocystinuria type C protein homolog isoform X1 [Esox lucius]|uniref:methylmalonic aciduria and homocystinuria type C protein homolog isoform X1 n=1 Tax=Esox lucius TaxID=8010 RepID=UPI0014769C74|nr:methylmalonic aciduria and homocystinuria type C protein homolog isoform X1 [Esox lucius]